MLLRPFPELFHVFDVASRGKFSLCVNLGYFSVRVPGKNAVQKVRVKRSPFPSFPFWCSLHYAERNNGMAIRTQGSQIPDDVVPATTQRDDVVIFNFFSAIHSAIATYRSENKIPFRFFAGSSIHSCFSNLSVYIIIPLTVFFCQNVISKTLVYDK